MPLNLLDVFARARRRAGRRSLSALNVKLVTLRPGGVAPGSETFAAAQTISVGQSSRAVPHSERLESPRLAIACTTVLEVALHRAIGACRLVGLTRLSAKAVHSRRL